MSEEEKNKNNPLDPTIYSSLKFLRKTPWARSKVEELRPLIN